MRGSGAALRLSAVCAIEWILASSLVCVMVASFTGLLDMKYLQDAVSAIAYPQHRPMDAVEAIIEKESFQLALNMEILVLVSITLIQALLLFLALRRKRADLLKIWVSVQILLTVVISFPLVCQYSSLLHWRSSLPAAYGKILILSWVVWISYRVTSILIVVDELRRVTPKHINPDKGVVSPYSKLV